MNRDGMRHDLEQNVLMLLSFARSISPHRTWNFVEIDVPYEEATQYRQQIIDRMAPLDTVMDLVRIVADW